MTRARSHPSNGSSTTVLTKASHSPSMVETSSLSAEMRSSMRDEEPIVPAMMTVLAASGSE